MTSIKEQIASEVKLQVPVIDVGVAVALPNTVESKMRAICDLSSAIKSLSEALASVNVDVTISNCHIQNTNTGIVVKTKP